MDYIEKRRQEILNHLIENKIVEPGQAINAAFFKKIYFPYQEEISKEEFAKILEIENSAYRSILTQNQNVIILKSLIPNISDEEKEKIINELVENNKIIPGKLINYEYFKELYKPYKEILSEVQFANLLQLSYDTFTNLKFKETNAKVLKNSSDKLDEIKKTILNNLVSQNLIKDKQLISYAYFSNLYSPYSEIFTEKEFANLLGINLSSFYTFKRKNSKATIFLTRDEDENIKTQKNKIIQEILSLENIYPGLLINYKTFEKLYEPYKNKYSLNQFANFLEISHIHYLKKRPTGKASILKSYKINLSKEEKQNIIDELLQYKVKASQLISYDFFLELYEPYKEQLSEKEFHELLEITGSNFRSFKYEGTNARILKSYKPKLSDEEKQSIVDDLFSSKTIYQEQRINYKDFLKLYEPYKEKILPVDFAKLLGISFESYYTIRRRPYARAVIYDYKIKEKINSIGYILSKKPSYYSKDEIIDISKKYDIDINLILKYIFCGGAEERVTYFLDLLDNKEKLYYGREPCTKKFAEKYSKTMIDIASRASLRLCYRYQCLENKEDFATDALIYILEKGRHIEENYENNDKLIKESMKAAMINHIKYHCYRYLAKPKTLQTTFTYTNKKGDTKDLEGRYMEDKSHNLQNIVEEKDMVEFLTNINKDSQEEICIAVLMKYLEAGLERQEALEAAGQYLEIEPEKMKELLQNYLINKNKVKKTDHGDYILW